MLIMFRQLNGIFVGVEARTDTDSHLFYPTLNVHPPIHYYITFELCPRKKREGNA